MVSGKARARRPDAPASRRAEGSRVLAPEPPAARDTAPRVRPALPATAFLAVFAAIVLSSCGPALEKTRQAALAAALGSLDSIIASASPTAGLDRAFAKAYRQARASSDWLSILKRARKADSAGVAGVYASAADRARKAFPRSEALAAAAAHAYLRSGRAADAFALFHTVISPEARPTLWSEAFVATRGAQAKPSDYGRYAELSGDMRAYFGAAASALGADDRLAARAWLDKGLGSGLAAPPELLWDCGLLEVLAARSDQGSGPADLELMGDAAWMAGDPALARRRWERSAAQDPRRSWKPYEKLALMAGEGEAGESFWNRLKSAFLSGPAGPERDGALEAYAAYLVRQGRDAEALDLLRSSAGAAAAGAADGAASAGSGAIEVMAALIKGRGQPEARLVVELERIVAERPRDPVVLGAALRSLAQRGRYEEVSLLLDEAERRGLGLEYGWYYKAGILAARGDFRGAAAAIPAIDPDGGRTAGPGAAGDYALGSLYGALGDTGKAAQAYSFAADAARGGGERCAAFKALGRALRESGDAAGAFRSAAAADPLDLDAAILARVSTSKQ
jgi:hypothetical protein